MNEIYVHVDCGVPLVHPSSHPSLRLTHHSLDIQHSITGAGVVTAKRSVVTWVLGSWPEDLVYFGPGPCSLRAWNHD